MPGEPLPSEGSVGERIRDFRLEAKLSLSELASRAELSKGYLSTIETAPPDGQRRPSADVLVRLADALGVTLGDLLGEDTLEVPPSLEEYAAEAKLGPADTRMLAGIKFGGAQPTSAEAWGFIYTAIKFGTTRANGA